MRKEQPPLTKCHSCGKIFWVDQARSVGEADPMFSLDTGRFRKDPLLWFDSILERACMEEERSRQKEPAPDAASGSGPHGGSETLDEAGQNARSNRLCKEALARDERKRRFLADGPDHDVFCRAFAPVVKEFAVAMSKQTPGSKVRLFDVDTGPGLDDLRAKLQFARTFLIALRRIELPSAKHQTSAYVEALAASLLEQMFQFYERDRTRRKAMLTAPGLETPSPQEYCEAIYGLLGDDPAGSAACASSPGNGAMICFVMAPDGLAVILKATLGRPSVTKPSPKRWKT